MNRKNLLSGSSESGSRGSVFGLISVLGISLICAAAAPAQAQQATVTPDTPPSLTGFEAPDAGTASYQGTAAYAINAAGQVTGVYWNGSDVPHGYVRAANGTIAVFNAPGAGGVKEEGTVPVGIDTAGDVAGVYVDSNQVAHGFVRSAGGTIATFSVPSAGTQQYLGTFPDVIDAEGDIAGAYADNNSAVHGFVRSAAGTITTFDAPGILLGTTALSMNASGVIAGAYADQNKVAHGFIRAANGQITTFEAPGAAADSYSGTVPIAIDAAGDVTGVYLDANSEVHGFVRAAGGSFSAFQAPGAGTGKGLGTYPIAIDANGGVAGAYTDSKSVVHGFFRAPTGQISTFDAPGAGTFALSLKVPGVRPAKTGGHLRKIRRALSGASIYGETAAFSIDAGGNIAGTFVDADAVIHGFLRAATGAITSFTAPGAGKEKYQGTAGVAIDTAGAVVGTYSDTNFVEHGYVFIAGTLVPTTLTLHAAQADSAYLEPATFKATIASGSGTPPNGEKIAFMQGKTQLGTEPLSDGSASFTTTALTLGADSITAVYVGDLNFAGSTSNAVTERVGKAKSFTALTDKLNPSSFRQPVTFTATVTGQYGGLPAGTVTFAETFPPSTAGLGLGTADLVNGTAKLTVSTLGVGKGDVQATYSGGSHFDVSISPMIQQVVDKAATTTELTSSLNPSGAGKSATFTATVKGKFGGTPGGTVVFKDGTTTLKTVTLSGAEAKFSTSTLSAGTHHLTAVYGGSADFAASTGTLTQTVN